MGFFDSQNASLDWYISVTNFSMAFFSIVIPTFNRAALLGKTIESVLNQRWTDFELLIVDDGSTDHTEEVVARYAKDSRLSYLKKSNGERGAARNFGAAKAIGKYINFFDSDDLMYPNHLTVAYEFLTNKATPPEIFHIAYDYRTPDGELIYKRNTFNEASSQTLLFDNILSCNGVFVRRDVALKFPFEEDRTLASAEDWALWIKLYARFKIQYCNEVTSAIISHDARSIRTINVDKLVARDISLISYLEFDKEIMRLYQGTFNRFKAERFTFIMLACSEQKKRREVFKWAWKSILTYPAIIFSRRFIASIKNSLI